jgi:hypothetical protein
MEAKNTARRWRKKAESFINHPDFLSGYSNVHTARRMYLKSTLSINFALTFHQANNVQEFNL